MANSHYTVVLVLVLGLSQVQPAVTRSAVAAAVPAAMETLRSSAPGRIVAGWEAEDGQIPHQISLRMVNNNGGVNACGGSIIHNSWVITAAHCVANRNLFVIRLGLTNLTRPEWIVEARDKRIYPRYNEAQGGVQTDDIALIRLDHYIPFGSIRPCRLQNSLQKNDDYTGIRLSVSGYGMTDDSWNGGTTSEVLRWVFLRGISNEECRSWYQGIVVQDPTICAEYYNNTAQSSCQGDSGGPLTFLDYDGEPTMVGVVSFGSTAGCNSAWPSAYVRPGHYHDWFYEMTGIDFDWRAEPEDSKSDEDSSSESRSDEVEEWNVQPAVLGKPVHPF